MQQKIAMNLKSVSLLILVPTFLLLLTGCGESSEKVATPPVEVESSADPELDLRFSDAVKNHVKTSWDTWAPGEKIGQCLITKAGSMTKESKQAVIEHGIEEAFDELSGVHLQSLSAAWDLCEVDATDTSVTSTEEPSTVMVSPTSVPVVNFESGAVYKDFVEVLQAEFQDAVDRHFDALTEKAGISVAVYKNGYLWRYAKGEASSSAEITIETPTLIRSSSKTFITALILQQIDDGLYSLSDTLGSVLSGNDDYESLDRNVINPDVTIEQLLTMTSGIDNVHDYFTEGYTALQTSSAWKPVEMIRLVTKNFVPPGNYTYSNTNTNLLGMIAEHTGGQTLSELYKSELLKPLDLVALLLPQDSAPLDTAHPYEDRSKWSGSGFGDILVGLAWIDDWYQSTGRTSWAAAGIITTPTNMAQWAYELFSVHGSAISPTARAWLLGSFTGPPIEIGGWPQQYGYHATKRTIPLSENDITVYGHPGGGGGYTSVFYYSPELDLAISLLANSHADARSRAEAEGRLTHKTLDDIGQQIFDAYNPE